VTVGAGLDRTLERGLAALGQSLPPESCGRLLRYVQLLARWNRAFNLTAVRDPAAMVSRHLLDSLVVLPWVQGPRVLDVGTGAGLPGIPLAIARPEWHFVLLDSNGKKTRFVTQAVAELGLANVTVVRERAEAHRPAAPYTTVISRAFAALADYLRAVAHLCAPATRILAMKGAYPSAELAELDAATVRLESVEPLQVPGSEGARHLVVFTCAQQMQ